MWHTEPTGKIMAGHTPTNTVTICSTRCCRNNMYGCVGAEPSATLCFSSHHVWTSAILTAERLACQCFQMWLQVVSSVYGSWESWYRCKTKRGMLSISSPSRDQIYEALSLHSVQTECTRLSEVWDNLSFWKRLKASLTWRINMLMFWAHLLIVYCSYIQFEKITLQLVNCLLSF